MTSGFQNRWPSCAKKKGDHEKKTVPNEGVIKKCPNNSSIQTWGRKNQQKKKESGSKEGRTLSKKERDKRTPWSPKEKMGEGVAEKSPNRPKQKEDVTRR